MSDSLYEEGKESEASDSKSTTKKAKDTSTGALPKEDTVLDRLKQVIEAKVEREVVRLEVPDRPGVHLRISPNITQAQMKAWRKNAGEETKNGLDPIRFACQVVGSTTVGMEVDGEEAFDDAGNSLNFAAPEVLEMTGASRHVPEGV